MKRSWIRRSPIALAIAGSVALVLVAPPPATVATTGWTDPNRVVAAIAPLSVSAVVDTDGHLHIAYFEDHDPGGLMYATDRGGWHKRTIAADVGFEAQPSIALDAAGHVYIAFARMTCPTSPGGICDDPDDVPISRIFVATDRDGPWKVRARSAGPADMWPSLAIADDHLHIAFQRQLWPPGQAGSGIWEATNVGGWHETQVASGRGRCFVDQIPSIEATPGGRTWIAYESARKPLNGCGGTGGIRVATSAGAGWTRETVTTERQDVQAVLALDPAGRPGLIFDRNGVGIRYSRRIGGTWTPLVSVSKGAEGGDLAFDAEGIAHIAAEGGGGIQVAIRSGPGFDRATIYAGPVDYGTYGGPIILLHPMTGLARVVFGRSEPDSTPLEDELGLYRVRQRR